MGLTRQSVAVPSAYVRQRKWFKLKGRTLKTLNWAGLASLRRKRKPNKMHQRVSLSTQKEMWAWCQCGTDSESAWGANANVIIKVTCFTMYEMHMKMAPSPPSTGSIWGVRVRLRCMCVHACVCVCVCAYDDDRTERHNSRFFTVSSLHRELSPICTLKWPRCKCVQITCYILFAQHVPTYVTRGMKGQLSY